jgi:hypothetical protein
MPQLRRKRNANGESETKRKSSFGLFPSNNNEMRRTNVQIFDGGSEDVHRKVGGRIKISTSRKCNDDRGREYYE